MRRRRPPDGPPPEKVNPAPIITVDIAMTPGDPACRHRWMTSEILHIRRCQACGRTEGWPP